MRHLSLVFLLGCLLVGVLSCFNGKQESAESALVLVLLGPPGSGKGTQAIKLCQQVGLPHISTGDLFRENMRNETVLGKRAQTFISQGRLVPDDVTLDMLYDRVRQSDCEQGYLLDGFPRTVYQAEEFDKQLSPSAHLVVLNLRVSDEEIIRRIVGRLICTSCGNIQHREFSTPRVEGKCDRCQGNLVQRADDTLEVVQERLKVYHQQTEPVIGYYAKKGLLIDVDGQEPPNQVFQSLYRAIKSV